MPDEPKDSSSLATTHDPVTFVEGKGNLTLEMIQGPSPGHTFPLNKKVLIIGKSESADIQIVAHGLSRRHAKLMLVDSGTSAIVNLVDLESTNGTFVNRSRIDMALVREGDLIQLGANVAVSLVRRRPRSIETPSNVLTQRQFEVARLVAAGARNTEIARFLEVTPRTVGSHLERIYRTLYIGSRAELTRWLVEHDLHHEAAP